MGQRGLQCQKPQNFKNTEYRTQNKKTNIPPFPFQTPASKSLLSSCFRVLNYSSTKTTCNLKLASFHHSTIPSSQSTSIYINLYSIYINLSPLTTHNSSLTTHLSVSKSLSLYVSQSLIPSVPQSLRLFIFHTAIGALIPG